MAETGAEGAPTPDITNPYEARRAAVIAVLSDQTLRNTEGSAHGGNHYWTDELKDHLDSAVARARNWNQSTGTNAKATIKFIGANPRCLEIRIVRLGH